MNNKGQNREQRIQPLFFNGFKLFFVLKLFLKQGMPFHDFVKY